MESVTETVCAVIDTVVAAAALALVLLAATLTLLPPCSFDEIAKIDGITATAIAVAEAATFTTVIVGMLLTNIMATFIVDMTGILVVPIAAVTWLAACVTRVCRRSDLLPRLDAKHQVGCKARKVT